ncbi:hypothetical protein PTKIN_Ptkin09bG0129900 [Pterospermum kingtungense]
MDFPQMIRSYNDVGLSLTKQILHTKAEGSNMVFSPLSIQLIMTEIAASSNGATHDQLLRFLKSESLEELGSFCFEVIPVFLMDASCVGGPLLSSANDIWMDKSLPFNPSFKETMDIVFRADSNQADFQNQPDQAISEVNLWVEKETKGLIKEVLPPKSVDKYTRLIFTNAMYFKGAWNEPFESLKTEDQDFNLINGSSVKVPYMTSHEDQIIGVYDGFKVLRLPYKQGDGDERQFSMYIFLPGAKDGLPTLVEKITSESASLELYLPSEKVKVGEFKIPRFKLSFGFEASQVLKGLGLELPISCGEGRWKNIVDSPHEGEKLYISNIFHKFVVEINEEGTKSDAVTSAVSGFPPTDFVADHPFLFLIREDLTGAVMFIGHVMNPLQC